MRKRQAGGGALVSVVASTFILTIIGVFGFALIEIIGGHLELEHATDSGNLSIAKRCIKETAVDLSRADDAFFKTVSDNGKVHLLNYNRLVAQTVLVCANCRAIYEAPDSTAEARSRAYSEAVNNVRQLNSVGQRLKAALATPGDARGFFNGSALACSIRMLGNFGQLANTAHDVAFLERDGSGLTNVTLTAGSLPPGIAAPATGNKNGKQFLLGYQTLTAWPEAFQGVPVQPGEQPHLVATSTFNASQDAPGGDASVPPNAFKSKALAASASRGLNVTGVSAAIVGALDTSYNATIPGGVIKIVNEPGIQRSGPPSSGYNLFNEELRISRGITVTNNGLFSTNRSALEQWQSYNNNPGGGMPSPDGIYNSNGNPATLAELSGISGVNPFTCTYMNTTGPGADPSCSRLLPGFQTTYSRLAGAQPGPSYTNGTLTAIELDKAILQDEYIKLWDSGDTDSCVNIAFPSTVTGLRRLTNGRQPDPAQANRVLGDYRRNPPICSSAVSPYELLTYIDEDSSEQATNSILPQLYQRCLQLNPDITYDQLVQALRSLPIDLGQTLYLFCDSSGRLQLSASSPSTYVNQDTAPIGTPRIYKTVPYSNLVYTVNAYLDHGTERYEFDQFPAPGSAGDPKAIDLAVWTPSTGPNLVGELRFRNQTFAAGATFCKPN